MPSPAGVASDSTKSCFASMDTELRLDAQSLGLPGLVDTRDAERRRERRWRQPTS
jgi:hypothetical protein